MHAAFGSLKMAKLASTVVLVVGVFCCSSVLGQLGTGPEFVRTDSIAVEASGDLVVTNRFVNSVFRVDPVTGDRTIFSDTGTGAGPAVARGALPRPME